MPCILPTGLIVGSAAAAGGLASNLLANWLQKHFDTRENDPSLPDRNHDLLRVIANATAHEIGEFARTNDSQLGKERNTLESLATDTPASFVDLFESGEIPDIDPPNARVLLAASAGNSPLPPTGSREAWLTIVQRLCSRTGLTLNPHTEEQLANRIHEHLWESIRKALKRDFAQDGKGYAALHLQFMGDVMARLDELTQPNRDQAESEKLSRDLLQELQHLRITQADPKARRIVEKAPPGTQAKLHTLIQRYEQLSSRVDRGFQRVLHEIQAADRASRSRDQTTHRRLAWSLGGIAALAIISTAGYVAINRSQQDQRDATDQVQQEVTGLRDDVQAATLSLDAFRIEATALVDRYLSTNRELSETIQDRNAEIQRIASALREAQAAADNGDEEAERALAEVRRTGDLALLQETLTRIADEQYQRDQEAFESRQLTYIERCREIASIAYLRGDIDAAESRARTILAVFPHDPHALERLGFIAMLHGDMDTAETTFRTILEHAVPDDEMITITVGNLGLIARLRGEIQEAEELFQRSLAAHQKTNNLRGQVQQLGNLGLIAQNRGELDNAKQLYLESLAISQQIEDLEGQAACLGNLGLLEQSRGNYHLAREYHQDSLDLETQLSRLEGRANQIGNLGMIALQLNELDRAESLANESLDLFRQLGAIQGQANQLGNLAIISQRRGDLQKAFDLNQEALELFREMNNPKGEAHILANLSSLSLQLSMPDTAIEQINQALHIHRETGNRELEAYALTVLANIQSNQNELELAIQSVEESVQISRDIGSLETAAYGLGLLGILENQSGDTEAARKAWTECRELHVQFGTTHRVEIIDQFLRSLPPEDDN